MQGRFSGRLETKEDEKRLADECRLLGPYLSPAASADKSMQTLAKIVRGIASGEVRQHVEARERELQVCGALSPLPQGCLDVVCERGIVQHSSRLRSGQGCVFWHSPLA